MQCPKCGCVISENLRVCPSCGRPIDGEKDNISLATTYRGPLANPTPVLVWGILGLSFAFFLSFLGIIFSAVGLKKASAYNAFTNYAPSRMASVGRKLSKAGLIVSIIITAVLLLCFLLFFRTSRTSSISYVDLYRL